MKDRLEDGLQPLPLGVQSFETLRGGNYLYIDKTAQLQALVQRGARYFLSRPRRFGKSLTLSTLAAMFSGRAELFDGLAAEAWVKEQAKHPSPVLRISMARGSVTATVKDFDVSLYNDLRVLGLERGLPLPRSDSEGALGAFKDVVEGLRSQGGPLVVLIDEYDKPILDNIGNMERAEAFREYLRAIYLTLKDYDDSLRFVMLTGISKFTKLGVFSAMNNLQDISMDRRWGALLGCTQREVEENFGPWIDAACEELHTPRGDLLAALKKNYDGFCFDGATSLYNPFSILNFFEKREWGSYWFDSGVPNFIAQYAKDHEVAPIDSYSGCELSVGDLNRVAIEAMDERGLLYQAGILTIREIRREKPMDPILVLDYPNEEVRLAFSYLWGKRRSAR